MRTWVNQVTSPVLALAIVVWAGGCRPADETRVEAEPGAEQPAAEVSAGAVTDDYMAAYNAKDAAALAALYTEDGRQMLANGAVHEGRAAIAARTEEQMPGTLEASPLRDMTFGDDAVAVGEWALELPSEDAGAAGPSGHWMAHYRLVDGAWLIASLLSGNDTAQPAESLQGADLAAMPADGSTLTGLAEAFERAWNAGDVAGVTALYDDDAWISLANQPPASGEAAIAELLGNRVAGRIQIHGLSTVDLGDGWYLDEGWFEVAPPEGGPFRGRYTILVRTDEDGRQRIHWEVSNGRPVSAIPES